MIIFLPLLIKNMNLDSQNLYCLLSIKNYTSDHAILKKGVHLYKQMPWRLHDTPRLHENRTEKGERKDTAVYFNRVPLIGLGPWGIINS